MFEDRGTVSGKLRGWYSRTVWYLNHLCEQRWLSMIILTFDNRRPQAVRVRHLLFRKANGKLHRQECRERAASEKLQGCKTSLGAVLEPHCSATALLLLANSAA